MDPSSAQHRHQEIANSQTLESMLVCTKTQQEKKHRPPEQALKCPRCDSTSTKFCYYNNYSLSQPRYFCKSCRRYWTKGGTLRNVPVGGGCRKNKRSSSSSSSSSCSSLSKIRSQDPSLTNNSNPLASLTPLTYDSSATDLNLAFARLQKQSIGQLGFDDHHHDQFPTLVNLGSLGVNTSVAAQLGSFDHHGVRNGFLESTNGFHNLYYGNMSTNGRMGHAENGSLGVSEEMEILYKELSGETTSSTTLTTMKQEICNMRDGENNRVLWGFPWQIGGDANMVDHHLHSSGRQQSWSDLGSSWHGMINSPLM